MKIISGSILLSAAENAYAHAQLVGFPNHQSAAAVLAPARLILLILGSLLLVWGVFTETRPLSSTPSR